MHQTTLFDDDFSTKIVNVASVPKLSPFRYPGGKTWFVPYIRQWLSPIIRQKHNLTPLHPKHFIEPFVGGGSISLTVASEQLAPAITMIEIDAHVGAVWQTVLNNEEGEWLAQRILTYDLTPNNANTLLYENPTTIREHAFQTIVKNRVSRGGILAPGAGLLKSGEAGKGILSRWYPETLAKRIRYILSIRDRITFLQDDGLSVLASYSHDPHTAFFIDPPYTAGTKGKKAGQRLYTHSELDHEQLFDKVSHIQGDFLMTYDNSEEVHTLSQQYGFETHLIPMKNTHHANMTELLIGRNLSWLTLPQPKLSLISKETDT